jgi:hypothetical protein
VWAIACCCKMHRQRHVHHSQERVLRGQHTCTVDHPLKVRI